MPNDEIKKYIEIVVPQMFERLFNDKIKEHSHEGYTSKRILLTDVFGLFETVSVVPTQVPQTIFDQVKVYVSGATLRLYWYDTTAGVWHYVTATA